jgi:hypothetical protein
MEAEMRVLIVVAMGVLVAGCATVRQQDLDAWRGVPVAALDTHRVFVTMPLQKTLAADGTEVRVYSNTAEVSGCSGGSMAGGRRLTTASGWARCVTQTRGCHNIFYIRDGLVQEYAPTGDCFTDESAQPGARWRSR